ncbi:hypothetical protein HAX54_053434 [Datura stramonium]|uniref:Uncharacterized protein n=1 Tax=Datura stramonium TaxID=4076 RepID=A0ABS8T0E4_DATST|nr:hypothetical protein [Datura stramonium]
MFCNFEKQAAEMLKNILRTARREGKKPSWMVEGIWARLNERWTTEEFEKISIQAKAPRASYKILTKCDQNFIVLIFLLFLQEKKKGRTMTLVEPHVESTYVGYMDEWDQSQPTSEDDSSTQSSHDDEASILLEAIGGVKKGRASGLGSRHCLGRPTSGLSSAAFSSPQNQEDIDSLRRQVQELSKKHKADRLILDRLENLVRHLTGI